MGEPTELHVDPDDSYGRMVGVMAAFLAVFLSIFTICAHRSHTQSIEFQSDSNDQWSFYQAKKNRDYQLEMNTDLLKLVAASNPETIKIIAAYADKHAELIHDLATAKTDAEVLALKNKNSQKKALYFDFAEGVLEISLVMSSLYFISRKKFFPIIGGGFGILGLVIGLLGAFCSV